MGEKYDDPNYVFGYDETSKSCLVWKNPKSKFLKEKECGTFTKTGLWAVQFRGMPRLAHRVVYEMFYGLDHDDIVYPLDGDYSNCKVSNLKVVKFTDKNKNKKHLENGEWHKAFDYMDGELYWKEDFWSGKNLQVLNAKAGDHLCTTPDKDGYLRAKIGCYSRSNLMLHRMIYEWHSGKIPEGMQIDHINGINTDNRIENLRCVDGIVNSRNQKMNIRNKTGFSGVRIRRFAKGDYYVAFWRENGKQYERSFSVNKYGRDEAFQLACDKRAQEIERLNALYKENGYTHDHGFRVID